MSCAIVGGHSWEEFAAQALTAIADPLIRGVIVTPGPGYPEDLAALGAVLRRIETCGKPSLAVLQGAVAAAAVEVSLACQYRIAADDPSTRVAMWDPRSGSMPSLGATQRLPRLIGVERALRFLTEGRTLSAQDALEAGLVDCVAPADSIMERAREWIDTQNGISPPRTPAITAFPFAPACAKLRERTLGLYPAPLAILSSVFEGCKVDLDTGLKIESRYYAHVRGTPEARNLARLRRYRGELDRLVTRPVGVPPFEFSKIGILGAGMMGSGIASVCAEAGLDVVLLDVVAKRSAARIHATCEYADLRGCEVVIEAVFEDRVVKADVTRKTEAVTGSEILFASNTSTLPIAGLAEAWSRPANFIGMHFFSPVDRMPLVEIIRAKQTSDACLAQALDLARKLRKTPIVVNDSRGFYTSRVFSTYVNEGMSMLLEGIAPALIENSGRLAGMPVGPLVLADEVSLDLMRSVRQQAKADLGDAYRRNATDEALRIMIDSCGRHGKKARQGFYEYPEGGRKRLWPDLAKWFPVRSSQPDAADLVRRFRWIQSLESVRCMQEGVLQHRRDADVGSVLGWGFCPALGGTIGHIETVGPDRFLAESDRLSATHGERFSPPGLLNEMEFA